MSGVDDFEAACGAAFGKATADGRLSQASSDLLMNDAVAAANEFRRIREGLSTRNPRLIADWMSRLEHLGEVVVNEATPDIFELETLMAEALQTIRPDSQCQALVVPESSGRGPESSTLEYNGDLLLVVWDDPKASILQRDLAGMSLHEVGHADEYVVSAQTSPNEARRRAAEIMADLVGQALAGPGFTAPFRRLQQTIGIAPDFIGPTHPSVACRADFLNAEADDWEQGLRSLMQNHMAHLAGQSPESEQDFARYARNQLAPFRPTLKAFSITPEAIYASKPPGKPESACAALAARELS